MMDSVRKERERLSLINFCPAPPRMGIHFLITWRDENARSLDSWPRDLNANREGDGGQSFGMTFEQSG